MSKKETSRSLKAQETKQKIYNQAVELFKEAGFEETSVDAIVERAGVSKGTFYVHYESKVALILDYVQSLDLDYEQFFASIPKDRKASEKLLLVTERIADKMLNQLGIELLKIIYVTQVTKTASMDSILNYNRKLYQIYQTILAQGIKQGEFIKNLDVDTLANHFVSSIRGMIYEWCIRYPQFDLKKVLLEHHQLLLTGISMNRSRDSNEGK